MLFFEIKKYFLSIFIIADLLNDVMLLPLPESFM
jgi:hypothetical protein